MAEKTPAVLDPRDIPPRFGTIYPPEYAKALQGREKRALGDPFGLAQYGVNQTTLPPGCWSSQRHWHEKEDEFVYVLSGEITLIDDVGEHLLQPGMCAGFKAGAPNGHHLVNKSNAAATYLEIGSRMADERCAYPDADMKGEKAGGAWKLARKDGSAF